MGKFVSGNIVKIIDSSDLIFMDKIAIILQPYQNNKYILGIVYTTNLDIKGTTRLIRKIIFKEMIESNLVKIDISDNLTEENNSDIEYLKNELLTNIRKRKLNK